MRSLTRKARKKQKIFTGPHILVVDDEPNIVRFIQKNLERHDYQVQTANSGVQALAIIKASRFDLLITDVMMPEMDGIELMEAVRDDIGVADLLILLLTARPADVDYGQKHEDIFAPRSTGERVLWKPFNPGELVNIVREMLCGSNPNEDKNA